MLGRIIHKYSLSIILITFLLCGLAVYVLPNLKSEVNFEKFMLEDEPAFIQYKNFTQVMGSSDDLLIMALHNDPTIYDSAFLKNLSELQTYIDSIEGISNTISLLDLKRYTRILPGYYHKRPYLQANHPERFEKDSLLIHEDYPVTQYFISEDNRWTKLIFHLKEDILLPTVDSIVKKIDKKVAGLSMGEKHLMGRKYIESEFLKLMNSEFRTSLVISMVFIILVLWWLHRSIAGVILPVLCMVVSLLMLYGYMAAFNRPLTILSSLFPTIILIIGISDVIHISSKFSHESILGLNPVNAIDKTLKEIGLTTLINTSTTAIGFLTLLTMSMKAMQSFGIDAAVGLFIAWINAVFLLPALLVRFNLADSFGKSFHSKYLKNILTRINQLITTHPKVIVVTSGIIVFISAVGIIFINTNNYILTSLPENNRLRQDFAFFDKKMGGGRTLELIIKPQSGYHVYDQPVIENIGKLESYLKDEMDLNQIISPALAIKWLHRSEAANNNWILPSSTSDYNRYKQQLKMNDLMTTVTLVDSDGNRGRLSGRLKDEGRLTMKNKMNHMQKWIENNINTSIVQFQVTGSDYLTDLGHQRRIENTIIGFLLEVLVIAVIIGLLYKSGLLVLITFIANIIPIIFVAGIMEHIEEAGIHSGDSACALPPHSLLRHVIADIERQTRMLAEGLGVVGLMNIQFAVKESNGDSEVYLIEVNPRASRTVPFVAKTTGTPIAKIAARVMAGEPLSAFRLTGPNPPHVAVKEAVFPFARFPNVDILLGPEMKSTGEVMGLDHDFGHAFAKSQLGAGVMLPESGTVFVSVKDRDKDAFVAIAARLHQMGFNLLATSGTARWLEAAGLPVRRVNKVLEGQPHIVDAMINGEVHLVFNTTDGQQAMRDSFSLRRTALVHNIPYCTTVAGARAAVEAITALKAGRLEVAPLQSYLGGTVSGGTVSGGTANGGTVQHEQENGRRGAAGAE